MLYGLEHQAKEGGFTSRRLPYSSYFPSHTSSVLMRESGCGLSGPQGFSDSDGMTSVSSHGISLPGYVYSLTRSESCEAAEAERAARVHYVRLPTRRRREERWSLPSL